MATRKSAFEESSQSKRPKLTSTNRDPKDNPYLAHRYEDAQEQNGQTRRKHLREDGEEQTGYSKRKKLSITGNELDVDASHTPDQDNWKEELEYTNGFKRPFAGTEKTLSPLAKFPRHATNAALARKAEDGPNNPFNGQPLSPQYFDILKVRRGLPVHTQRFVYTEWVKNGSMLC